MPALPGTPNATVGTSAPPSLALFELSDALVDRSDLLREHVLVLTSLARRCLRDVLAFATDLFGAFLEIVETPIASAHEWVLEVATSDGLRCLPLCSRHFASRWRGPVTSRRSDGEKNDKQHRPGPHVHPEDCNVRARRRRALSQRRALRLALQEKGVTS